MKNSEYILDEKISFELDGSRYPLRIRSNDINNPVVLFLHGGVGSPDRGQVMKYQSPLADRFTLVAWDQRGAGLAYTAADRKNYQNITKDSYVEDAHNVVMYLKKRFEKDKIIVVGHSFGSVLGVWLVEKYPEDVTAFVGVGQCIDYLHNEEYSYRFALEESKRIGDKKSIAKLEKIGAPIDGVYRGNHFKSLVKQRAVLHKLGGATYANRKPYWQELLFHDVPIMRREYSLGGLLKYVKGLMILPKTPLAGTDPKFLDTVKKLDVPVYLLLGHHDQNCSYELAQKWYDALEAPDKKLIWFENSAHSPQWEEPDEWNAAFTKLFYK